MFYTVCLPRYSQIISSGLSSQVFSLGTHDPRDWYALIAKEQKGDSHPSTTPGVPKRVEGFLKHVERIGKTKSQRSSIYLLS